MKTKLFEINQGILSIYTYLLKAGRLVVELDDGSEVSTLLSDYTPSYSFDISLLGKVKTIWYEKEIKNAE